ncbi:sigma-70 family RNA polymerase sigma factor [Jatrophihabitans sp. YIM 134969]
MTPWDAASDPVTTAALAARGGSTAAAETFVRSTQDDVWRLCRYLGPAGQVDDLAQETYARAFAGLRGYAGRAPARSWLLGIARHVCADAVGAAVRDRGRRGGQQPDEAPSAAAPDHAGAVHLDLLLGALEPERREAFVLTQVLGFGYADAAAVCGCPVGTIRSRVARARDDLRAATLAD